MISGKQLRQQFLDYFTQRQHTLVPSSSLVPVGDDTLLFTNAGMVQFKEIFLGRERRAYTRACSSQKCVRAGGKHNDLESVGRTARHHTLFEMLGNFSFGDYFKREAISYAWEFLTQVAGLDPSRMYATVYRDDDEAFALFRELTGLPPERILRFGEKDNFWAMGDTGPCGPCAELHYDRGEQYPGDALPNGEGDRVMEIWNLVFMQYDRDAAGKLTPLPSPCIDTGMGLERLALVVNGLDTNYDTDLLRPLISRAEELSGVRYHASAKSDVSLQVLADHARAVTFLLGDGVLPSNEGRGYVLRRILRRALRHGRMLGIAGTFFPRMAEKVLDEYSEAYPDLRASREHILNVITHEEERFRRTLDTGMELLGKLIGELRTAGRSVLPGQEAFSLYDTYGFPLDLTVEIAEDAGLSVDMDGYTSAMAEQSRRAREAHVSGAVHGASAVYHGILEQHGPTRFLGYSTHQAEGVVLALVAEGASVAQVSPGSTVEVFLDQTPFYAESGGQVGDSGTLMAGGVLLEVTDCTKPLAGLSRHTCRVVHGEVRVGDRLSASVDSLRQKAVSRNHTATHALHWALREVLGDHVRQAGSLVAPERLRFDFTHFAPVSSEELAKIERLVNERITEDQPVAANEMGLKEAMSTGAMALFGEKYGEVVRVVSVGEWSKELCGGIHVGRSGEMGTFLITREESVSSGVRRIEAVSGAGAVAYAREQLAVLASLGGALNTPPAELPGRVLGLQQQLKSLEKELNRLRAKLAKAGTGNPLAHRKEAAGVPYVALRVDGVAANDLRNLMDEVKQKLGSGVVVLGAADGDKVTLVVGVTADLTTKVRAGDVIKPVAALVGGSGGGRPDMAQAGGKLPEKLDEALELVGGVIAGLAG